MFAAGYADGELVGVVSLESYPSNQASLVGLLVVSEEDSSGIVVFDNMMINKLPDGFYPLLQP
jgi:hypothetical protein